MDLFRLVVITGCALRTEHEQQDGTTPHSPSRREKLRSDQHDAFLFS